MATPTRTAALPKSTITPCFACIDTMMLDNLDAPWSSTQPYHPDGLREMYVPAVEELRRRKMGVWANGPHVLSDGSVENASLWSEYLGLASFTTLFEISYDNWLLTPPEEQPEMVEQEEDKSVMVEPPLPPGLAPPPGATSR